MERLLSDAEKIKAAQGEVASYSIDSYADIVEAIHVVQEEMGITGTTAKEAAETISGSAGAAKAAIQDLLTGMGNADADMAQLVKNAGEAIFTLGENAGLALGNIITAPVRLVDQLTDSVWLLQQATEKVGGAAQTIQDTGNVLDLIDQYHTLEEKLQDTSLTEGELATLERERAAILNQLAEATGNAAIAAGGYNDQLELEILKEQLRAKVANADARAEMYKQLQAGSKQYQQDLYTEALLAEQQEEAQRRLADAADLAETIGAEGAEAARQRLIDLRDAFQEALDNGEYTTETVEGLAELQTALAELEAEAEAATGMEYTFTDAAGALGILDDAIDGFDASDVLSELEDAENDLNQTTRELDEATLATKEFEIQVLELVEEGLISEDEAARYLNTDLEGLADISEELHGAARELIGDGADAADAALDAGDAIDEATLALDEIENEASAAMHSGEDLRGTYERLTEQLEALDGQGDSAAEALARQRLAELNLLATSQELTEGLRAIPGALEGVGGSSLDFSSFLIDAGVSAEDFAGDVASMRDEIISSFKLIVDESSITAEEMGNALGTNLETTRAWGEDLTALWNQAYRDQDTAVMEYISYLADQGPSYAAAVHEFASGGYEELQSQAKDFEAAGKLSAELTATGIYMNSYLAGDAGQGLSEEALAAMEGVDGFLDAGAGMDEEITAGIRDGSPEIRAAAQSAAISARAGAGSVTGFYSIGQNISRGIANGITAGTGWIRQAAQSAAQAAITAAQAALDIHSPSKVFRDEVGLMIPGGIAEGIQAGAGMVSAAVRDMAGSSLEPFQIGRAAPASMEYRQLRDVTINVYTQKGQDERAIAKYVMDMAVQDIRRRSGVYGG